VLTSANFVPGRRLIPELALKHRLPSMFGNAPWADAGGLLSYAPDFSEFFRRAAEQVGRILKGAKPADMPVEQPTTFELVVNLKTAKALGTTIPQTILIRANRVIE
jgi:putative ABC transport system substrate-binding protein